MGFADEGEQDKAGVVRGGDGGAGVLVGAVKMPVSGARRTTSSAAATPTASNAYDARTLR